MEVSPCAPVHSLPRFATVRQVSPPQADKSQEVREAQRRRRMEEYKEFRRNLLNTKSETDAKLPESLEVRPPVWLTRLRERFAGGAMEAWGCGYGAHGLNIDAPEVPSCA